MNVGRRFWAEDNTDINRMFPGYDQGETTQRIAARIFEALQGYSYGVQMADILDPRTGRVLEQLHAGRLGRIFFAHKAQLIAGHEVAFKILPWK